MEHEPEYQGLDDAGERILDELEKRLGIEAEGREERRRRFVEPLTFETDMDHHLAAIDASWPQHVKRLWPPA